MAPHRAAPASARGRTLAGLTLFCAAVHLVLLSTATRPAVPGQPVASTALQVRTVQPLPMTPTSVGAAAFGDASLPARVQQPPTAAATARRTAAVAIARSAEADDAVPDAAVPLSTPHAPVPVDEPGYLATSALEMPPLPRSAPDAALVEGAFHSGQPIRLRLYVESDGAVSNVDVLSVHELDEAAAGRLAAMFRATAFVPGRRHGRDVAAYMDVEILSLPEVPALHSN